MRYYKIGNRHKKSVYEIENFKGNIDGVDVFIEHCITWRGGEFIMPFPSKRSEIKAFAEYMGYETLDEMLTDYGVRKLEEIIIPGEDVGYLELDSLWEYDMENVYDPCEYNWDIACSDDSVIKKIEKYLENHNLWDLTNDYELDTTLHTYHIEGGIYYDEYEY